MASIRRKIQLVFSGSIFFAIFFVSLVFSILLFFMYQNQQIIDRMISEYSIISHSEKIIQDYNTIIKNSTEINFRTIYKGEHEQLINLLDNLSIHITSTESKNTLEGLRHTVNNVLEEYNKGITEIDTNNY